MNSANAARPSPRATIPTESKTRIIIDMIFVLLNVG